MKILGKIEQIHRSFSHGGCEVLRLSADLPTGTAPVAAHCAGMVRALCDYAEGILFPDAARALAAAAREGRTYLFARRHYRIALTGAPAPRGHCITLNVTLSENSPRTGSDILEHHTLETFWDRAGEIQFPTGKRAKIKKAEGRKKDRVGTNDII